MPMRLRVSSIVRLILVVLILAAVALPARAQQVMSPSRSLLATLVRQEAVRAAIVSGRIVVWKTPARGMPLQRVVSGKKEKLTIRTVDRKSMIQYERSSADEEILIEIARTERARLARIPKQASEPVPGEYVQQEPGGVRLVVGRTESQKVYQAASLWHLSLAHREACQQYLVPLLKLINDSWDVVHVSEQVEKAMAAKETDHQPPDRHRWDALVEQLGSEQFTQREAADRELRAVGPRGIWYLQTLDPKRLDPEQRFRIQRILLALTVPNQEDTVDQVVRWLAGDPQAWLILLNHAEESTRRVAAEQLRSLLDRPIAFDPTADAPTRQRQIEQLRANGLGIAKD